MTIKAGHYSHDNIYVLFQWIIKQDYKKKTFRHWRLEQIYILGYAFPYIFGKFWQGDSNEYPEHLVFEEIKEYQYFGMNNAPFLERK